MKNILSTKKEISIMSIYGGPDIIEDGLSMLLDAGNLKSYPGSGTT